MTIRAVTAQVLYTLWFALAFGLATVRQYRHTGDTGLRIGSRYATGRQRAATMLMAVALSGGLVAPVAALLGLPAIRALTGAVTGVAGVAVVMAGVAATVIAQRSMGSSWRVGVDPSEAPALVTGGVFGWVRNPIFSAMMLTAAGMVLIVPNAVAVASLVCAVAAIQWQVRFVEEPHLRSRHAEAYAAYERRTGRFVPGIGRSRRA